LNENILIGIIAAMMGALPKIYELIVRKNKDQNEINTKISEGLAKEAKEIRESLKEDIRSLVTEVADLRKENVSLGRRIATLATENQHLEKENLLLRIRVSELETQLKAVTSTDKISVSILKDYLKTLDINKKE
jgi:formyltetrahydrofolate hydrolase